MPPCLLQVASNSDASFLAALAAATTGQVAAAAGENLAAASNQLVTAAGTNLAAAGDKIAAIVEHTHLDDETDMAAAAASDKGHGLRLQQGAGGSSLATAGVMAPMTGSVVPAKAALVMPAGATAAGGGRSASAAAPAGAAQHREGYQAVQAVTVQPLQKQH